MLITIFFQDDTAPAQLSLPDDCLLSEPEIKQHVVIATQQLDQPIKTKLLQAFNTGTWEVVDDDGDIIFTPPQKRVISPEAPPQEQNSLMTKIEQLQHSQSQIKQLTTEIEQESAEINARLASLEEKQAQVDQIKQSQREMSHELVELQKLLNELLTEEED